MKTFQVCLTKSYLVIIKAENEERARFLSEFFTSDSVDLSTEAEKKEYNFSIEELECTINEAFDCEEIEYAYD